MKQLPDQVEATSELQRFLNKNSEIKQDISLPQKHFLSYSFPLLIFEKKKFENRKIGNRIGKLDFRSEIQNFEQN